jgi:hypothetical protein
MLRSSAAPPPGASPRRHVHRPAPRLRSGLLSDRPPGSGRRRLMRPGANLRATAESFVATDGNLLPQAPCSKNRCLPIRSSFRCVVSRIFSALGPSAQRCARRRPSSQQGNPSGRPRRARPAQTRARTGAMRERTGRRGGRRSGRGRCGRSRSFTSPAMRISWWCTFARLEAQWSYQSTWSDGDRRWKTCGS